MLPSSLRPGGFAAVGQKPHKSRQGLLLAARPTGCFGRSDRLLLRLQWSQGWKCPWVSSVLQSTSGCCKDMRNRGFGGLEVGDWELEGDGNPVVCASHQQFAVAQGTEMRPSARVRRNQVGKKWLVEGSEDGQEICVTGSMGWAEKSQGGLSEAGAWSVPSFLFHCNDPRQIPGQPALLRRSCDASLIP